MMNKATKMRLDQLLVHKGLVENPSKARARIMAGDVIVGEHRADKPGEKFGVEVEIRLRGNSYPFVSRGGLKLEHALTAWPSSIEGRVAIDVGASTGGFSEVLLEHGVQKVYAVDVGYGQLAEKLRTNPLVINMERTHILELSKSAFPEPLDLAVIDVSFISLEKVLPHVVSLLAPEALLFALIKPQFEAGRENVTKGGIVRDASVRQAVIEKIKRLAQGLSLTIRGVEQSPILGAKGNVEFLIALLKTAP